MPIEKHKVVSLEYTLTGPKGKVIDSSNGRGPLTYLHGVGGLIPGLERELEGKNPGDTFNVTIAPEDAYGQRDPNMVQQVPRSNFPQKVIQVGQQFRAQTPNGQLRILTIVGFQDDKVTVDANHALAGLALTFDVKVVDVRDATEEEITHGHVHGPGGHHH
ncbi:MAG: peptidylprolyl isomerase [Phycisphaeraceae bacterium]|nr:peptidylprolyl isomerase [Phycisphaeraceae bacterium]